MGTPEHAIHDTYKDVTSLVAGLHDHRLELMNTEAITSQLSGTIAIKISSSRSQEGIEELVAQALHAQRVNLRKAILAFVESHPTLHWILKNRSSGQGSTSLCLAARFPRPPSCEGRNAIITDIVAIVTGQSKDRRGEVLQSSIVHGVGGIGKSTVALEVLRYKDVVERFHERRFFIGCDGLSTLDDLLDRLLTMLAIKSSSQDAYVAIHEYIASAPTLLVLDNFEDLCATGGPARGLEDFLTSISEGVSDATVSLIVTKRGDSTVRLPGARSFYLAALDLDASMQAFLRHADREEDAESDPDLPALIARLDGYPLAIMLLAHQFTSGAGISARELGEAYDRRRDELLARGAADDRHTSLRVSADLSLNSPTMSVSGARNLCFLLSLLPDGADSEIVEAFLEHGKHAEAVMVKRAVVSAGLAAVSAQGLLRMLAPLREYISGKVDVEEQARANAWSSAREHMEKLVGLSTNLQIQQTPEANAALRNRVSGQLANITSIINEALASDDTPAVHEAIKHSTWLADFIHCTRPFVPGFLPTAIAKARQLGYVDDEVECLLVLGAIELHRHDLAGAAEHYQRAYALLHRLTEPRIKGQVLRQCGKFAVKQGDLIMGRSHFDAALELQRDIHDRLGIADSLRSLGSLAIRQNNLASASSYFEDALHLHSVYGNYAGLANAHLMLGDIALQQGDLSGAEPHLKEALHFNRKIGADLAEAHALRLLGNLALMRNDLPAASVYLPDALRIYREREQSAFEADTHRAIGNLYKLRGDAPTARAHLENALRIYRAITGKEAAECEVLRSLEALRLAEHPTTAAYFDEGPMHVWTPGSPVSETARRSPKFRQAPWHGDTSAASPQASTPPTEHGLLLSARSYAASVKTSETTSSLLTKWFPKRFFILKALTVEDLSLSVERGRWATQSHNGPVLDQAFRTCPEGVFLIFSANKSGEFFGYARMTSQTSDPIAAASFISRKEGQYPTGRARDVRISGNTLQPVGEAGETIKQPGILLLEPGSPISSMSEVAPAVDQVSHHLAEEKLPTTLATSDYPFAIRRVREQRPEARNARHAHLPPGKIPWGSDFSLEWISTQRLPFHRVKALRNPFNGNREIRISRDGTEVAPTVGEALLAAFAAEASCSGPRSASAALAH